MDSLNTKHGRQIHEDIERCLRDIYRLTGQGDSYDKFVQWLKPRKLTCYGGSFLYEHTNR